MLLRPPNRNQNFYYFLLLLDCGGLAKHEVRGVGGAQGFREAGTAPPKELQPSKDSIQFFTILGG